VNASARNLRHPIPAVIGGPSPSEGILSHSVAQSRATSRTASSGQRERPQFEWLRSQSRSLNGVPGLDEDDYDDIPADGDPYNVALTNEYLNGDWPPPAATIALDELPGDLDDIGEQIEHFPSFPTLSIDPATEANLVRLPDQRGYEVRRNDELINRI
jgi:hypothetical protein